MGTETPQRKRLGRPRRIDRDKIVEAALAMPPGQVTMQSVADRLGVDRSALHYHVKNKDELLALVAAAAVSAALEAPEVPEDAGWRELTLALAWSMRRAGLVEAEYQPYLKAHVVIPTSGIEVLDRLLAALHERGLSEAEAIMSFSLLARFAYASARDEVAARPTGVHPALPELTERLAAEGDRYATLRRSFAVVGELTADEQFGFGLEFVMGGMERLMGKGKSEG